MCTGGRCSVSSNGRKSEGADIAPVRIRLGASWPTIILWIIVAFLALLAATSSTGCKAKPDVNDPVMMAQEKADFSVQAAQDAADVHVKLARIEALRQARIATIKAEEVRRVENVTKNYGPKPAK